MPLLLSACMQQRVSFVFNEDIDKAFFAPVVSELQKLKPETRIDGLGSISVYQAAYKETYIEDNHLLEWSELHDNSTIPRASYYKMRGSATRLYLFKLNTQPQDVKGVVFLSAKFDSENECLGFGPAYIGLLNPEQEVATFTSDFILKETAEALKMVVLKRQVRREGVMFYSKDFGRKETNTSPISVEKVIQLDPNKLGGFKPVVFDVKEILRDKNAMLFHFIKTIE